MASSQHSCEMGTGELLQLDFSQLQLFQSSCYTAQPLFCFTCPRLLCRHGQCTINTNPPNHFHSSYYNVRLTNYQNSVRQFRPSLDLYQAAYSWCLKLFVYSFVKQLLIGPYLFLFSIHHLELRPCCKILQLLPFQNHFLPMLFCSIPFQTERYCRPQRFYSTMIISQLCAVR